MRLGRVAGIPIRAEWSLLVIAGLLSWMLASATFPELGAESSPAARWATAVCTTTIFLASLLAHELSHSVVAGHHGIRVESITLWLLGGIARLRDEPSDPRVQLRVALAGPAASGALALTFGAVAHTLATLETAEVVVVAAAWLATVNLVLAIFNLVPAAPLDGGRVLHALLWRRRGDRLTAGISAARAGTVFAYILFAFAFIQVALGEVVGGVWFALLGWFVSRAARTEELTYRLRLDLAGLRVSQVMTPHPVVVDADLSVADVLDGYMRQSPVSTFPVVDRHGTIVGLITPQRVVAVPAAERGHMRVADAAAPLAQVGVARPSDQIVDAIRADLRGSDGRLLAFDDDRLVGIVSPTDIKRVVHQAELRRSHRGRSRDNQRSCDRRRPQGGGQ